MIDNIGRPSQLILIRHPESIRNRVKKKNRYFPDDETRNIVRGIPDHKIPVTEEGFVNDQKTGLYLRRKYGVPDYFYDSGYVRTIQGREGIMEAFTPEERARIKVRSNTFIRERDPGYTYDMTTEEAEASFPWLSEYWQTFGGFLARPPGGESLADVAQRVYMFISMIFRDRKGMNVWADIHGGTLRAFRYNLERWTYDQALDWPDGQSPENCGITVYNYDESQKRLVLKEYNTVVWT